MTGEQGDMQNIRGLGVRRQVPHLHVLDHALPRACHRKLLCEVEWTAHAATPSCRKQSLSGIEHSADEQNDASTYRLLVDAAPTAKRFSRVPSMFDSLGVEVPYPT